MLELFEFPPSGNCHKIRLMLSFLGLPYESRVLNAAAREHKSESFLKLNPFGQVPVLKDGDVVLRDSQAILVYLARQYGGDSWFPASAVLAAEVSGWLSVAANEIVRGPAALRAQHKFGRVIPHEEALAITETLLRVLDQHLTARNWLVGDNITIADVALYPYLALAGEGKVDLSPFQHLCAWLQRIENQPGYISMPGIHPQEN